MGRNGSEVLSGVDGKAAASFKGPKTGGWEGLHRGQMRKANIVIGRFLRLQSDENRAMYVKEVTALREALVNAK